jgi:16S rRNA (cytidine1402-2'-O)-methyltransferase
MTDTGRIYIVATPIGNPEDITLRALEILRSVDVVICEEMRQGSTLLKKIGITPHLLIELNEHNEAEQTADILVRLYNKENVALISDCGTPVFADPGHYLIQQATDVGILVVPIPGPSSLMAALSILGFPLTRFLFAGFLPRESAIRKRELTRLRGLGISIILMDTPYRLGALLEDVANTFGKGQQIVLACNLTMSNESIYRGSVSEIRHIVGPRKAEFVLVVKV